LSAIGSAAAFLAATSSADLRNVLPGILASEDAAEGLRNFVERRAGHFTGR